MRELKKNLLPINVYNNLKERYGFSKETLGGLDKKSQILRINFETELVVFSN